MKKSNWIFEIGSSGYWIGSCDSLGLYVQGETYTDACAAANESIDLLVTTLIEDGDIKEFMQLNFGAV